MFLTANQRPFRSGQLSLSVRTGWKWGRKQYQGCPGKVHLLSRNGKLVLVDGPVYLSAPGHSGESEEQSLSKAWRFDQNLGIW